MVNLIDPSALPDSRSAGPETWTEAVTTLAGARDAADTIIENSLSDRDLLEDIYKQRIDRIESLTGEKLENPIRSYAFGVVPVPGFLQPTEREAYRQYEDEFEQKVQSLSERYPQLSGALSLGEQQDVTGPFSGTVEAERLRRIQDADRRAQEASASPALGMGGRLAGEMLGGLRAAARDPLQWQMAVTAGGGTMAKTVAGRIGQTVMQEALLNGGQELVLQGLSQERKREAGLEHGMNEMLANAGIAATFGAIFGGTLQGGAEIARVFKLGEGGAERAARVLDGRPEPGDVEAVAAAMGAQLDPLQLGMLTRSFEDRVLDDVALRPDASPNEMRVYEAAQRYAEDPDNNPPPELLERMLAEEDALRTRFSPDEYERMFAGDPNAIDDIGDTFFADSIDDAARRIDEVSASTMRGQAPDPWKEFISSRPDTFSIFTSSDPISRARELADEARLANADLENSIFGIEGADRYRQLLRQENSSSPSISDKAAAERQEMEASLTPEQEEMLFNSPYEADPSYWREVSDTLADYTTDDASMLGENLVLAARNFRPEIPWEDASRGQRMAALGVQAVGEDAKRLGVSLDDLMLSMEAAARRRYPDPDDADFMIAKLRETLNGAASPPSSPRSEVVKIADLRDPIDGQTIKPPEPAEPLDDAAFIAAEKQAGEIVEPPRDANGNPERYLDFVGVEDGDGNVKIMSTAEALAMADEPDFFADLMEACKL